MKVCELIEHLRKCDPLAEVEISSKGNFSNVIKSVSKIHPYCEFNYGKAVINGDFNPHKEIIIC